MPILLADLLDEKHVDLELRTRTQENAIRKLVQLFAANEQVREPEIFLEQVLARERANPSVVEHGVTFPHARTDLVEKIVLGIGRSRAGISFGKKGERAHLIFLIGVPQKLVSDYLVCVGALARLLKDDAIREQLLRVDTVKGFLETLRVE
ncbi:MAG: PTS sugar transporter subunit IIA [Nitrospirae bacterium]|nr:MAG: PTS sugar transporter subunit IIA [Nitrospirota bacterium]